MVYFQGVEQDKGKFSRSRLQQDTGQLLPWGKMPRFMGKEDAQMTNTEIVRIAAGALAVAVIGIIAYRRKQKAA